MNSYDNVTSTVPETTQHQDFFSSSTYNRSSDGTNPVVSGSVDDQLADITVSIACVPTGFKPIDKFTNINETNFQHYQNQQISTSTVLPSHANQQKLDQYSNQHHITSTSIKSQSPIVNTEGSIKQTQSNDITRQKPMDDTDVKMEPESTTDCKERLGSQSGRKFTAHVLPPCRVCGAQATGFHYGVNTCEACKGFFHRSLTRKNEYVCLKNSKCEIKPGRRNSCSYCRYQRCLAVNMSKEGIKTGRYTYEKRTKDILELKKMDEKKGEAKTKVVDSYKIKEMEKFISEVMSNKDKMVESMLKDAHKKYNPNFDKDDLERGRTKLRCLVPPSTQKFQDNDELVTKWIDAVETSGGLRHIITFIKATPGFKNISMTDQIQIIKASFCELWIIGRHPAFNPIKHTFTSIHGIRFDLVQALGQECAECVSAVVVRLQKLKLSEEESFMLMLFVVFMPDRCHLSDPSPVESIKEEILHSILHIINKKLSDTKASNMRWAQINSCLTDLRTISHMYHALTKKLISSSAEIPPLFWELISLS